MHFLGCLFILIFGGIFLLFAFSSAIIRWIYSTFIYRVLGIKPPTGNAGYGSNASSQSRSQHHTNSSYDSSTSHTGNAHHEGRYNGNSRQRRNGKIFTQDEGTYVDFEEVK